MVREGLEALHYGCKLELIPGSAWTPQAKSLRPWWHLRWANFISTFLRLSRDFSNSGVPTRERATSREDRDRWLHRTCGNCGEPMVLLVMLSAVGFRPATALYKCNECRYSISEPIGPPSTARRSTDGSSSHGYRPAKPLNSPPSCGGIAKTAGEKAAYRRRPRAPWDFRIA
jgi:hypothetical protein